MFDRDRSVPDPSGRRLFLTAAAGAAASLLVGRPSAADAPFTARRERSLSFFNTHTGESVSAVYWADGSYREEALTAFNRVLRDHRTGGLHAVDTRLLDLLHTLRGDLGTHSPFHVISCYRSPATNASLRSRGHAVAEHSLHMETRARRSSTSTSAASATGRRRAPYRPTTAAIRLSASSMFSMLLAYEKRRCPSPNSPKAVPLRQATPASSSSLSASARLE
ncbi:MAG: Twin-arginine translocation pathway signal [Acidobacteria bacterium]|nr:MAG: Twin-arginine translocation pathway signal [Acidobacteriota bacterium]